MDSSPATPPEAEPTPTQSEDHVPHAIAPKESGPVNPIESTDTALDYDVTVKQYDPKRSKARSLSRPKSGGEDNESPKARSRSLNTKSKKTKKQNHPELDLESVNSGFGVDFKEKEGQNSKSSSRSSSMDSKKNGSDSDKGSRPKSRSSSTASKKGDPEKSPKPKSRSPSKASKKSNDSDEESRSSRSSSSASKKSKSRSPESKKIDDNKPTTSESSDSVCGDDEEELETPSTKTVTYRTELKIPPLVKEFVVIPEGIDFTGGCSTGIRELITSGKVVPHLPIIHPGPSAHHVDIKGLVNFFECEIRRESAEAEAIREAHDELLKHKKNSLKVPPRSKKYSCDIEKIPPPPPAVPSSSTRKSSITRSSQTAKEKSSLKDMAVGSQALVLSQTRLDQLPEDILESSFVEELESQEELDSFLRAAGPNTLVIVDFYADWCSPCAKMLGVLDEFANELTKKMDIKFGKANIDKCGVKEVIAKFGVKEIPTFVFFRNAQQLDMFSGGKKKAKKLLMDLIMKHIQGTSDE